MNEPSPSARRGELRALAGLFLKLGLIGFGGPAAHIALMEDEVVRRRKWLSREEFLDLLGATNLIPGPNSTEMAIHIGHRRAGWPGLMVAGVCFIVPAMVIVMGCAWGYVRYGKLPEIEALLYGIKPVIIAIVFQALWGLAKSAIKTQLLGTVVFASIALAVVGINELAILFGAGALVAILGAVRKGAAVLSLPLFAAALPAAGTPVVSFGLWPMFLFFIKVGSVLYGSGYVLLAFLRNDLVERFGWLSENQLLDAIAIGQVTPGPVFTTATFIGYLLGGTPGAMIATAGIFLPAFIFVAISGPLIPRIRRSAMAGAFLDGVNAASLALMAVVTLQLTRSAIVDALTIGLGAGAAFALIRFKLNSVWLVVAGAIAGLVKSFI